MKTKKTKLTDLEKFNIRLSRLLEEHEVKLFINGLESFSAVARKMPEKKSIITDDFTAVKAVLRLHDKVFNEGEYKE